VILSSRAPRRNPLREGFHTVCLIQTCKLNSIDPLAWLTDVLQRIVPGRTKNHQLHTLLPWNWRQPSTISPT
jgi:hypothetical protein